MKLMKGVRESMKLQTARNLDIARKNLAEAIKKLNNAITILSK